MYEIRASYDRNYKNAEKVENTNRLDIAKDFIEMFLSQGYCVEITELFDFKEV